MNSESLNNAINALQNKRFLKLICGASNNDPKQIERLVLVYSLAGIDAVDISADKDSYIAAKSGIENAKKIFDQIPDDFPDFNEPLIMVSVNAGDDPHFRKIKINPEVCSNCMDCTSICPAGALDNHSNKLKLNTKSCYGCARCIDVCKKGAITLNSSKNDFFITEDIEAVEIHTGKSSIKEIMNFLDENSIIKKTGLISFSVESSLYNRRELIEFVQSLVSLVDKKFIVQIDGKPMGANNTASSSLQALAAVQILSEINSDFFIQIAGGINHLTKKYLSMFDLPISGIGYGTFARKIILPYIVGLNDTEFLANLKKCVNITTSLVDNNSKSVKNVV